MKNKFLIIGVLAVAGYLYYKQREEAKRAESLKADASNGESSSNACGCSNASGGAPVAPVSNGGW